MFLLHILAFWTLALVRSQVYLIRQRIALEALPRTAFLTGRRSVRILLFCWFCCTSSSHWFLLFMWKSVTTRMTWADFPLKGQWCQILLVRLLCNIDCQQKKLSTLCFFIVNLCFVAWQIQFSSAPRSQGPPNCKETFLDVWWNRTLSKEPKLMFPQVLNQFC